MFEELHSANKGYHSTETTPVKVFNDIMLSSTHICVFVWLRYWDYVGQLPHVGDYVFVKSSCIHTREKGEPKRAYVL